MERQAVRVSVGRHPLRALRLAAWRAEAYLPGKRPAHLPAWTGSTLELPPLIIGGTGRSGTSVTAKMLGCHARYYAFPFEVKFITDGGGLTDVIAGGATIPTFEKRLLTKWFQRKETRGLHRITDHATLRAAVRELDGGLKADPFQAARRFTLRLLEPSAVAAGKQGWIDSTPNTIRAARRLTQILPEARLVHLVRDGRDVACSLLTRTWGPDEVLEGLRWWAQHLEASFREAAAAGEDRVLTLRMEDLLLYDREASFRRLLEFLGLDDDPAVRQFFEERATGDRAHIGRWRTDIPPEDQPAFLAAYHELAAGLAERWGYDPDLIDTAPPATPPA
jgi:hypothetical protein